MSDAARVKGTGGQRRAAPARSHTRELPDARSAAREVDPAEVAAQLRSRRGAILTEGALNHQDEAVATELSRSAYSRERFIFLLRTLYCCLALIAVLTVANVYLAVRPIETKVIAKDPMGGIKELVTLEKPLNSQNEMLAWATNAVTGAFTLSFSNYQQQLQDIRFNFTEPGWKGFQEALRGRGVLDAIINSKFVSTAVPTAAPVVLQQGLIEGQYAWRIEIPLIVTYESASGRASQSFLVEATIIRRPETENPRGLGIQSIVAR
jgi:intracellular multiplication protein IcmL